MPVAKYTAVQDLETEIPVFPLTGVILLPRTQLPLNIFEPRYLAMIDAVLAGSRLLGIVQPDKRGLTDDGQSPRGKTAPVRDIGSVGRLTALQETDDGRYIISLTGVARFRIEREIETEDPFRRFSVDYSDFAHDLRAGDRDDETVDRAHLLDVLKSYLSTNDLTADWSAINSASTEFLVNTLAMIAPYGTEEKQALLQAHDLRSRAETLITLAEMDMATPDDGSGTKLQ